MCSIEAQVVEQEGYTIPTRQTPFIERTRAQSACVVGILDNGVILMEECRSMLKRCLLTDDQDVNRLSPSKKLSV